MEHRSPTLQANSFLAEPLGKPKNTVVGRLSLLQWIFPAPGIELKTPVLQAAKVKRWQSAKLMVDKLSYQPHKLSSVFIAETL